MKSKALLLLFIFLLNTATGFACAVRMSLHEHDEATEHHHEGDEAMEHHHGHRHAFQPAINQKSLQNSTLSTQEDPCCQGAVNSFNTLAKVTPQSGQIELQAPFIYLGAFYQFFLKVVLESRSTQVVSIDGRRRPPTYPIRIALQSFQI